MSEYLCFAQEKGRFVEVTIQEKRMNEKRNTTSVDSAQGLPTASVGLSADALGFGAYETSARASTLVRIVRVRFGGVLAGRNPAASRHSVQS